MQSTKTQTKTQQMILKKQQLYKKNQRKILQAKV
jgi:hypothetical protein